jgi:ribose 1,5-bisphosphokinase PhnN
MDRRLFESNMMVVLMAAEIEALRERVKETSREDSQ